MESQNHLEIGSIYYDDTRYVILATSLARGEGYKIINYPDAPPETDFPPAYPMYLALFRILFPFSLYALKVANLLLTLIIIILLFYEFRNESSNIAFIIPLVFAFHPMVVLFSTLTLSEPLFLLFLILAFFGIRAYYANESTNIKILLTSSVLIAFAFYTRFVGIALLPAFWLYGGLQRKWKHTLMLSISVLILLTPWMIRNYHMSGYLLLPGQENLWESAIKESTKGSYTQSGAALSNLVIVMKDNASYYVIHAIPNEIFPILGSPKLRQTLARFRLEPVLSILAIVLSGVVLYGIIIHSYENRGKDLIGIFLVVYIFGLLFWPFSDAERFLYPVFPFLLFYFYWGVKSFLVSSGRWIGKVSLNGRAINLLIIVLTIFILLPNIRENISRIWTDPITNYSPRIMEAGEWLNKHTSSESVILAGNPQWLNIYSDRRTTLLNENALCNLENILSNEADYIFIGPDLAWSITPSPSNYSIDCVLPILSSNNQKFTLVFSSTEEALWIYKILPNGGEE